MEKTNSEIAFVFVSVFGVVVIAFALLVLFMYLLVVYINKSKQLKDRNLEQATKSMQDSINLDLFM
jgi:uncharacterized membrane protein